MKRPSVSAAEATEKHEVSSRSAAKNALWFIVVVGIGRVDYGIASRITGQSYKVFFEYEWFFVKCYRIVYLTTTKKARKRVYLIQTHPVAFVL